MKPIYGIVGNGRIGSILKDRPDFTLIDCDVTDFGSIQSTYNPDLKVIVNCAALSNVNECERDPHRAHEINILGANNLMMVYGAKVLNISSDYVFGGWWLFPPTEKTKVSPINVYGMTKVVVENFAIKDFGAKVLRLSRTIALEDRDIKEPLFWMSRSAPRKIPSFFYRNYLTPNQAANGIEYAVRHFDTLPPIINYGSNKPVSFFTLMQKLGKWMEYDTSTLIKRKDKNKEGEAPRPKKSGFSVKLAKKLGFPIYTLDDVINAL